MSERTEHGNPEAAPWWGSWMQTAKEKSISVFNVVKQDLAEFGSIMQCDGSKVANVVREKFNQETAASASAKMKQGMTSLWGELSKALVIPPEDDECCEIIKITNGKPITLDRVKAQLFALQTDINTYTEDPGTKDNKFQPWMETSFDLEQVKSDISELLVSNSHVRSLYTQLVPLTVSNVDFWCRYFYKKHLLEEEENRRIALVRRAEEVDEKELTWDEDDDATLKDLAITNSVIEEPYTSKQIQQVDMSNLEEDENLSGIFLSPILLNVLYFLFCLIKSSDLQHKIVVSSLSKDRLEDNRHLKLAEDTCLNPEPLTKSNEVKLEDTCPSLSPLTTKNEHTDSSESISDFDSTGESPTDDWEVCNNVKGHEAPSDNGITQPNEDWEEW